MVGIPPDDAAAIRIILANAGLDAAHAELHRRFLWMTPCIALATLKWLNQSSQPKQDVLKGWARRRSRGER